MELLPDEVWALRHYFSSIQRERASFKRQYGEYVDTVPKLPNTEVLTDAVEASIQKEYRQKLAPLKPWYTEDESQQVCEFALKTHQINKDRLTTALKSFSRFADHAGEVIYRSSCSEHSGAEPAIDRVRSIDDMIDFLHVLEDMHQGGIPFTAGICLSLNKA